MNDFNDNFNYDFDNFGSRRDRYDQGYDRYTDEKSDDTAGYDPEVLEQIRQARLRRERADQLAKDRLHAKMVMAGGAILILIIIVSLILKVGSGKEPEGTYTGEDQTAVQKSANNVDAEPKPKTAQSESDGNTADTNSDYAGQAEGHQLVTQNGITYVDGIMIVNKTFSLPSDYDPGLDPEASEAFNNMAAQAWSEGVTLWICSGYRTYDEQVTLFEQYASQRGLDEADAVSARPGHSEHQTGLCMDINTTDFSFEGTTEAVWLEQHCTDYGFIIRFPKGKESITGYEYEPWHIRYVGVETAQQMKAKGLCLEEYLNVTSDYADSPDNEEFRERYAQYADITADPAEGGYNTDDYGTDAYNEGYYTYDEQY